MKNKPFVKYLLIAVIAGLWVYIGSTMLDIFSDSGDINPAIIQQTDTTTSTSEFFLDTFELDLSYRSPFGNVKRKVAIRPISRPATINSNNRKPLKKVMVSWPVITYHGIVKNNTGKKIVAITQLNGKSSLVQQGDIINNLTVVKIYKDSIRFRYEGELRTFTKR